MRSDTTKLLRNSSILKEMATCVSALLLCVSSGQSLADDTEIFFRTGPQPNVLFILDVSGSMATDDENDGVTRLDKLKTALQQLLNANDSFNAGLMSYSSSAITLLEDIKPVADTKTDLIASITGLASGGGTTTQRALYEGMLYYRGDDAWSSETPQTYQSPLTDQCQSNHIVLLSDGLPTADWLGYREITRATGKTCSRVDVGDETNNGNCGAELADYLRDTDHSLALNGFNNIVTHTVGLSFDEQWLGDDTSAELLDAFATIVNTAQSESNSFVAPSVTVDQFSRLSHREDTYLALFQPGERTRWAGNLKRYSFSGNPAMLRDKFGHEALDSANGTFHEGSHSYWSELQDGAVVANGGAANELDVTTRKVYTYTGEVNLNHHLNAVHEDNEVRLAPLFTNTPIALDQLLQWARGVDIADDDKDGFTNDTRYHMGDPLHSVPTVLNYGGSSENPDSVVFVGTNEGYLHAINSIDGTELYSFIPPELLDNLGTFYENEKTIQRPYGLDGDITLWIDDKNNDGVLDPDNEHAYLYVGMRRGGNNYYALDVTTKDNPKFLWSIKGGGGDFAELGQSWSKPTVTKVQMNGEVKDALVFGGGYDPMQDYSSIKSPDTIGRSLFIVDANDGSLLWSPEMDTQSDYSKMEYSMPSDPQLLDIDNDGFVDQIYIGDMGGQLWRFDLKNDGTSNAANSVTGGLIASLSGTGIANNRRFFYPPDVVVTTQNGEPFLSISIGSGNRAHPLDESVDNRFYMIRQSDLFEAPAGYGMVATPASENSAATYRAITESDLYDATANNVNNSDSQVSLNAQQTLESKEGWILRLVESGEKVLASSLTIENTILFSTYIPGQTDPAKRPARYRRWTYRDDSGERRGCSPRWC